MNLGWPPGENWRLSVWMLTLNFSNGVTLQQMNIWKSNVSQETDLNMQMHFEYLEYIIEYTNLYVGNIKMVDFSYPCQLA